MNSVPPALVCIANAESGFNQFTSSGAPLESSTQDYGVFQIHKTWIPLAKSMGLDIVNSAQDNITFGIYLYNTRGPQIWSTYKKYCESDV